MFRGWATEEDLQHILISRSHISYRILYEACAAAGTVDTELSSLSLLQLRPTDCFYYSAINDEAPSERQHSASSRLSQVSGRSAAGAAPRFAEGAGSNVPKAEVHRTSAPG